jgi:hypothetical protein
MLAFPEFPLQPRELERHVPTCDPLYLSPFLLFLPDPIRESDPVSTKPTPKAPLIGEIEAPVEFP